MQTSVVAAFVAVFALISGTHAFPNGNDLNRCWASGNGQAPKWWEDGSIIERGNEVFRCSGGHLQPYGCKSANGGQLRLGETEVADGVQFTCVANGDNLSKKVTGCVDAHGTVRKDGEEWEEASQWMACKRSSNGYYLRAELRGCAFNGERLRLNDRRVQGSCWMECQHDYSGDATMATVGCAVNGQTYEIGDTFESADGKFTEYCTKEGDECAAMTVGCIYNRQRLTDGDRYFKGDVIYQCQVRQNGHSHKVTGCVQRDNYGNTIERHVNCRWYQEAAGHEFEVTCTPDDEENTCYVRPDACIYMREGKAHLWLKPDSYTIYWDGKRNLGVSCRRVSKEELRIEEFPPEQAVVKGHGLDYATPRGKK